jgi:hypothetical protein
MTAEALQDVARRTPLVALLDLDETDVPLSTSSEDLLDRSLLLLFDALERAHVQVAIVTRRSPVLIERMKEQAPHAWWLAPSQAVAEVQRRMPSARIVAIGSEGEFHGLRIGEDLAVGVRSAEGALSAAKLVLRGGSAVRAMLWWIVSIRSDPRAIERLD